MKISLRKLVPNCTRKISAKKGALLAGIVLLLAVVTTTGYVAITRAEQSGGSPNNNPTTSRIKTIYDALVASSYGADAAGAWGDWGAFWNRIYSAATWVPSSNATVTDVKNGRTFNNNSRTPATGTYPNPTNCPTEQYHDSYGAPVTKTTNCVNTLTWTTASPAVTGDDNQDGGGNTDPRTGVIWSQYLKNNAGTVEFAATGGSTWSWDGSTVFTVTAASATAGATYTNNGATFTVVTTIAGGTSLTTTGTGAPAASGTLTKASGTGDATITFSAVASGTNNAAVGAKSASLLCSERGNGWRLPVQKELMQAYIDGSFWNLTNPSNNFWSLTETSSTNAWYVTLNGGSTNFTNKSTSSYYVRCVR